LFLLCALLHQLMSGAPVGALLARFESDAAAFQAKQPKLPKKGQRNILVSANCEAIDFELQQLTHWLLLGMPIFTMRGQVVEYVHRFASSCKPPL
jgi:hypothetical protein